MSKGAGGTSGGLGLFFIGIIMMCGGFYLLLSNIYVNNGLNFGTRLYNVSRLNLSITGGMIMIPFILGIGIIFYNAKNIIGWLLTIGSMTALIFGVISRINFRMNPMSAFDLIVILVLAIGGLGLFLRSLREF